MYSRAKVAGADGREHPVLTFGPLSVLPEYQRQGVGSALVEHSAGAARSMGFGAILIYGDPEYYSRFGFRPAEAFSVTDAEGKFHPALQALELQSGALSEVRGRFFESPVYHVDAAEAASFDADFPQKEKFVTESQRRFARLAGLPEPEMQGGGKMNNYEWLDSYLLNKPGAARDFKVEWGWHRYLVRGKMFAAVCTPDPKYKPHEGREMVILKCEPLLAELLRAQYRDVVPGFYCDKRNWNSIYLDGAVPNDALKEMCDRSYELVFSKLAKKIQCEIKGEWQFSQTEPRKV